MDASDIRRGYSDALPKPYRRSFDTWIGLISCALSAFGLIISCIGFWQKTDLALPILATGLVFFALASLAYSYRNLRRSRYHYANAVYYTHYVSHVIRDHTATLYSGDETPTLDEILKDVVTAIADCFSLLTETRCRCCIKSFWEDDAKKLVLTTIARDRVSAISLPKQTEATHEIETNTDFDNLWYCKNYCYRTYIENNLPRAYGKNEYKNSSISKEPLLLNCRLFFWCFNWPLPYKSTLVVPIRYVAVFDPPSADEPPQFVPHWLYRGFLCVDSNRKNVFVDPLLLELASDFADSLYTFLTNYEFFLNREKSDS